MPPSIGVSVRPHRAAYFAGETFECTIQFTHHHTPQQPTAEPANNLHQLLASFSLNSSNTPNPSNASNPSNTPNLSNTPTLLEPFSPQLHNNPHRKFSAPGPTPPSPLDSFNPRRTSLQPVGSSAPPQHASFPSNSNHSNPSGACLLAWTYCQLDGYFQVQEKYLNLDQFQSLRHPPAHGGGRLSFDQESDINQSTENHYIHHSSPLSPLSSRKKKSSSSRTSWMGWLFGSNHSSHPPQIVHSPSSLSSSLLSSAPPNRFPIFQNPVSLLDIDLRLQPGQSRSYSFSIDLPINLPPTHKSKWIKFNYELIIGFNLIFEEPTNPDDPSSFIKRHQIRRTSAQPFSLSAGPFSTKFPSPTTSSPQHKSRTFRVPIRIFNHVYLNQNQNSSYDLLKPIISTKDTAKVRKLSTTPDGSPTKRNSSYHSKESATADSPTSLPANRSPGADGVDHATLSGLADLEKYGLELLKGVQDNGNQVKKADQTTPHASVDDDMDVGCLAAIEMATRSSPKASFDIMKDGSLVAQLSLFKSTYRLGETIEGVIEMNGNEPLKEAGRVIKFGVSLESVETLIDPENDTNPNNKAPSSTSIPTFTSPNYHHPGVNPTTRKIYSEQEELVVDVGRAKFSLAIPLQASPEFETNLIKFKWNLKLRLQFIPTLRKEDPSLPFPPPDPSAISNKLRLDEEEEINDEFSNSYRRRPGSVDFGAVTSKLEPGVKRLTHSRSKSIGFFNQPNMANKVLERYSHLASECPEEGTYRAIADLGTMAIEPPTNDQNSSPTLYPHNQRNLFSPWNHNQLDFRNPTVRNLNPLFLDCSLPVKILPPITRLLPNHHSFCIS